MMNAAVSTLLTGLSVVVLSAGQAYAAAAITIPEPSSLALIAVGAGVLAWVKFRRR
jgi:hypothetical protein